MRRGSSVRSAGIALDHIVVFGDRHLRHLLKSYQKYYNEARTHLSLHKDAPIPRAVGLAIELRFGLGEFEPMPCGARALSKSSSHCVPLRKLPSLRRNDVCRAGTVA